MFTYTNMGNIKQKSKLNDSKIFIDHNNCKNGPTSGFCFGFLLNRCSLHFVCFSNEYGKEPCDWHCFEIGQLPNGWTNNNI